MRQKGLQGLRRGRRPKTTVAAASPSPADLVDRRFAAEQLECVFMAIMSLDATGAGRKRWTMRWKPALNAFEIAAGGRLAAGRE
jgi:hypothetical protein